MPSSNGSLSKTIHISSANSFGRQWTISESPASAHGATADPKQAAQMDQMKKFFRVYLARLAPTARTRSLHFKTASHPARLSPGFPWHAAYCGDLDLTGFRKPSSYYRDILWNGGDRVFATVRLPRPEGQEDHCRWLGDLSNSAKLDLART